MRVACGLAASSPNARSPSFAQHLASEAEVPRWPPARGRIHRSQRLDEAAVGHEAAEVAGVERYSGQGLHHLLQLTESEARREKFEDHRAIADLAAKPAKGSRDDPSVIQSHRTIQDRRVR